ncbi:hypothetical protein [Actinacidiphila acididurans]|uniref:AAA+ ATPase domain-containing protein n=1 Tax=Actinacidiphila acididurans TaxID=2784346 RepID=A0ABS2TLT5_9ACTN|nr:hypothetical protein [Actinacidiphila acididurans]MBM9504295.1 hypothetical protein [Actinacidiphila acididurans]
MPGAPLRPLGIQAIEDLVHDCWERPRGGPGRRPGRELPVVVLLGRHGSGKTSVLEYLAHRASTAPVAGFDFASYTLRPYEVAARLAFRLSVKSPHQPPLHFPRLAHGLVAVDPGLSLDTGNPEHARRQLTKATRDARRLEAGRALDALSEGVGLLNDFNIVPLPGIGLLAGLLLRGLGPRVIGAVSKPGLEWYGRLSGREPLDTLAELNRRSASDDSADRDWVDELLCEAFLSDLRAAYDSRPRGSRDRNCLVVLDNIDHGGGTRFLRLLLKLRESLALTEGGDPDPLLVVASASTARAVPGPFDPGPAGLRIRTTAQAGYSDWRAGVPQSPADSSWWWYSVQLPDLTASQITQLGRAIAPRLPEATPLVHRLTYGHPWSVVRMQQAVARMIDRPDADTALRGILDSGPVDRDRDRTPADRLTLRQEALRYLFQSMPPELVQGLVTCAASRDMDSAVNSALLEGFPDRVRETLLEETAERLCLVPPLSEDAGTRGGRGSAYLPTSGLNAHPHPLPHSSVLQPWLWQLLLRELAGRGPGDPYPDWDTAHQRLHDWHAARDGDDLDTHYHRLALGRVEEVVAHLDASLRTLPTTAWLYELYAITAAPMRDPVDLTMTAAGRADRLAAELAPDGFRHNRALTLLVTALWLAVDPRNRLPSAQPELNFTISASFRDLALHADANGAVLRSEAARYEARLS